MSQLKILDVWTGWVKLMRENIWFLELNSERNPFETLIARTAQTFQKKDFLITEFEKNHNFMRLITFRTIFLLRFSAPPSQITEHLRS